MTDAEKLERLVEISLFTLGYLAGKAGVDDPATISMALVLKDIGVKSDYVEYIATKKIVLGDL